MWLAGAAAGAVVTALARNPARRSGLIAYAVTAGAGICFWLMFNRPGPTSTFLTGMVSAAIALPLALELHVIANPAERRVSLLAWLALAVVTGISAYLATQALLAQRLGSRGDVAMALSAVSTVGALLSWRILLRPALELLAAFLFGWIWRIRVIGPGVGRFPRSGPVVVIANHAAWFDPLWLGKVTPRPITPLMTSKYYDLPIISWLMRHVIRTIRVQESTYRYHAPELDEAVRRLDRGECVVVFPEGWLRRSEDQVLRRFGQGVWRILRDRPDTPVVPFWIEGSWGSFTSYRNGPPMRGKPFDWFRRITLVMGEPEPVPKAILRDHRHTRRFLQERVLALHDLVSETKGGNEASLTDGTKQCR